MEAHEHLSWTGNAVSLCEPISSRPQGTELAVRPLLRLLSTPEKHWCQL